jgi:hypothetical protein
MREAKRAERLAKEIRRDYYREELKERLKERSRVIWEGLDESLEGQGSRGERSGKAG